jgi:ABC-2 type transport system ATP-binding protein
MIHLHNVSKHYGATKAVNELNLFVPAGEIFGFIGPNGAGKTTTIRMIGGLMAPTSGRVEIDGIDMAHQPVEAKRKIGLIPDRPFLYEKLTGMEFLTFTADLYGVDEYRLANKSRELLDLFSLIDRAHELIESYSHGMRQRLIMAAAFLHDPVLIIVDEPMVGLDPSGMKLVRDLFARLARKGTTIFISTHTLDLAQKLCDRIGIINKGTLIATGTFQDLKTAAQVGEGDLEQVFLQLTQRDLPNESGL